MNDANPISITKLGDAGSIFFRYCVSVAPELSHLLGGTAIVQALLVETVDNDPTARVDYDPTYQGRHVWAVALPHDLAGRIAKRANISVTDALRRSIEAAWRRAAA